MTITRLTLIVAVALALSACETESGATGFTKIYDDYFKDCASCHAPAAQGSQPGIETSLDFSTVDTAKATVMGTAKGLVGNTKGCNGVSFVVSGNPAKSLILAALDEDTRKAFDDPAHPDCDGTSISAMDAKLGGAAPATVIADLKQWITDGAP